VTAKTYEVNKRIHTVPKNWHYTPKTKSNNMPSAAAYIAICKKQQSWRHFHICGTSEQHVTEASLGQ